jgi:DNA modification methylase
MPEGKPVEIKPAKGRPMLSWVGKRPLRHVTAYPSQHIETFSPLELPPPETEKRSSAGKKAKTDVEGKNREIWSEWSSTYPRGGLLFHGDNKEVLSHLLANGFRGKVNLIYIDPPFDSGADYVRKVQLRGVTGNAKLNGETYTLGEQIQYEDIWANDNYLQFMYERLLILKELLSESGNIYLHCDWHRGHFLRCLMDEVFGEESLRNEIIWRYSKYQMRGMSRFVNNHDILYWYSRGSSATYNYVTEPLDTPKALKRKKWDKESSKIVNVRDDQGKLIYDEYLEGKVDDVWDIDIIGATSGERLEYPTQKPEILLERVINASSNPGDLILDCFIGSGTTAAVAQKLGRRWIGCDINHGAIQTTSKRLQTVIKEQIDARKLPGMEGGEGQSPSPAQLSFTVWRVNDYDLQIQHNEAVELACEHIGIERTRSDPFFDGTLGKKLVKIVPFNHPLTPLDLEEIKRELEARPEEDRNLAAVCLGKELAADAWLADWNRLRKGKNAINKIDVIELRSDPNYGGFIAHEPAAAKVTIKRIGGKTDAKIRVEIRDFISPSILQRLEMDLPLFKAKITDWRSMVDCMMIDTAYDGSVFHVALSDVPEKKDDLISGSYELAAPDGETTVAVKIIDMLGEEVLVTRVV